MPVEDGGGPGMQGRDPSGELGGYPDPLQAPAASGEPAADEAGPIGPFPSWPAIYGTVLVYGVLMILFLWILTRLLDPGGAP